MNHTFGRWKLTGVLAIMLALASAVAFAQGGATSTLSGTVVDTSGGVIPGADVVAKNNATATEYRAVTSTDGKFTIPAVTPGTYTVTVSLTGFKTWSSPDVIVTVAPASIKATLDVGNLEETVVVTGVTEIVQTQTAAVQTTLVVQQIQQLPVITHTALDYVVNMPGVDTPGSNTRSSTFNGLPSSAVNITLDGVNVQDQRSEQGFFMYIRPMMDSVEEITVTNSTSGAESSGQGATTIRMVTRSGSNTFSGSAYDTWRNQAGTNSTDFMTRKQKPGWLWGLNTPYWFNKAPSAYAQPKVGPNKDIDYINDVRLSTPGFRVGGPIMKDKAFFFFNSEWFLLPESRNRTYYVMNDTARSGIMTFSDGKTLNLLQYMAGKGQTGTVDPTIAKLLADINQASQTAGTISYYDQNINSYNYIPTATQKRIFPTLRLDYNLSANHRLTFNSRYNSFNSNPDFLNSADARFPGFPNQGGQVSGRYMWQASMRSTLGKNMVNEVRGGHTDATGKGTYFGKGVTADQFNCQGLGCQSAGGLGWSFALNSFRGITNATAYNGQSASVAPVTSLEDTLTWLRGSHTITAGGSWSRYSMRSWNYIPTYSTLSFGVDSNDPAYNFLTTTALKSAGYNVDDTWSGYARSLYALLTGRVTNMSGTAYLGTDGKYHFQGDRTGATVGDDWGFFASDSWRLKPNMTLTAGLRYEVQLPYTTDGLYSRPETWQMVYGITGAGSGYLGSGNLYQGGRVQAGTAPVLVQYQDNAPAYNTDWNNLAPNVGLTWRPNIGNGFLSRILSSDPVFRGGYTLSYTRLATAFFDSNYSGNPGRSRAASRSITTGDPYLGVDAAGGTQVLPVLLRDTSRLFPSSFPEAPTYPISPAVNETLDIHYPDFSIPHTHQYSFGFQREFGKSTALEIRYVGNTNVGGWTTWNMASTSQWSMLKGENGFYDEFRLAQQNLHANIVAGNGNTFAYTGAPGTSPLPIFMAYLQGIPLSDARNQDPKQYTASQFKSSSWYNQLSLYAPNLTGIAGTGSSGLQNGIGTGKSLDANRIKAGVPINFFIPNPTVAQGNAYLETTGGNTRYNGIQIELRRRMSKGLLVSANYQRSFGRMTWNQRSLREDWFYQESTGGPVHAFKVNWVAELPFGRGKTWGSGAGVWKDRLIGGWEIDGIARFQSGTIFNFGDYRLVGMTEKDLQDMFYIRKVTGSDGMVRVYMLPDDVIQNSIIALTKQSATTVTGYANDILPTGRYLAPASGPDCVQYNVGGSQPMCPGTTNVRKITGPMYAKVDMSFVKRIAVVRNMRIEARMDLFNVFDNINFIAIGVPGTSSRSSLTGWEVTSAQTDTNGSQDPGGRITQFGLRFSW